MKRSEWHMYTTSAEAWDAMLDACENATHSIRFKDYIFNNVGRGGIGRTFLDCFKRKAAEGVTVRIVLDAFGSWRSLVRGIGPELRRAGVAMHFHVATLRRRYPLHVPVRDHRKFLIVDAKRAFIGGVIVEQRAGPWRDTHLSIEGPIVKDIGLQYVATWNGIQDFLGPETIPAMDRTPSFSILSSGPGRGHAEILETLVDRIHRAKRRIYIASPFFSPPSELVDALINASSRGVDVAVLLPGENTDGGTGYLATASFYPVLRRAGIRLWFYYKYLHAKVVIIDDWATVGSANMDMWSLAYNYEINVASEEPMFVNALVRQYREDVRHSAPHASRMLSGQSMREKFWRTCGILFRPVG